MAIVKVKKTENYSSLPNATLRDDRLSLEAVGLLVRLLSRPTDWTISVKQLQAELNKELTGKKKKKVGRDKLRDLIRDLKKEGYVTAENGRGSDGRWTWVFTIYETRQPVDDGSQAQMKFYKEQELKHLSDVDQAEIDEYVKLAVKYSGNDDQIGFETAIRRRIANQGGLSVRDRKQLQNWTKKVNQATEKKHENNELAAINKKFDELPEEIKKQILSSGLVIGTVGKLKIKRINDEMQEMGYGT